MSDHLPIEEPPPIRSKYMYRDEEARAGYDTWEECAVIVATRWIAKWLPADIPNRSHVARDMAVSLFLNRDQDAIEAFGRLTAVVESEPERGPDGQIIPPMPRVIAPRPVIEAKRRGWKILSR